MHDRLGLSLAYIAIDEGGFAQRAAEPGGAVNKGVSMLVLQEWRHRQGKPEPHIEDLRLLTDEEAGEIYTVKYAAPIHFDELPPGLDYALLNTAVMEGVRGAMMLLQKALGIPLITGKFDAFTWDAIRASEPSATVASLLICHMNLKLHSPSCAKYGPGWGDRIVRVYSRAKEIMGEAGDIQTKPSQ